MRHCDVLILSVSKIAREGQPIPEQRKNSFLIKKIICTQWSECFFALFHFAVWSNVEHAQCRCQAWSFVLLSNEIIFSSSDFGPNRHQATTKFNEQKNSIFAFKFDIFIVWRWIFCIFSDLMLFTCNMFVAIFCPSWAWAFDAHGMSMGMFVFVFVTIWNSTNVW